MRPGLTPPAPAAILRARRQHRFRSTSSIVSKQDTHFFNTFSLVIGLLVVVALGIFALARSVASETQEKQMLVESHSLKGVTERVQPFARVAVAGQDNSALKIEATAPAGSAAVLPPPKNAD